MTVNDLVDLLLALPGDQDLRCVVGDLFLRGRDDVEMELTNFEIEGVELRDGHAVLKGYMYDPSLTGISEDPVDPTERPTPAPRPS